jgi:hypothetical protein
MNTYCPKCGSDQFQVTYVLLKVEYCPDCSLYSQYRVATPPFQGGLDMIKRVTTTAIAGDHNLPGLQAVLAQCMASVQRRESKAKNRNHGGSPKREQDWR